MCIQAILAPSSAPDPTELWQSASLSPKASTLLLSLKVLLRRPFASLPALAALLLLSFLHRTPPSPLSPPPPPRVRKRNSTRSIGDVLRHALSAISFATLYPPPPSPSHSPDPRLHDSSQNCTATRCPICLRPFADPSACLDHMTSAGPHGLRHRPLHPANRSPGPLDWSFMAAFDAQAFVTGSIRLRCPPNQILPEAALPSVLSALLVPLIRIHLYEDDPAGFNLLKLFFTLCFTFSVPPTEMSTVTANRATMRRHASELEENCLAFATGKWRFLINRATVIEKAAASRPPNPNRLSATRRALAYLRLHRTGRAMNALMSTTTSPQSRESCAPCLPLPPPPRPCPSHLRR